MDNTLLKKVWGPVKTATPSCSPTMSLMKMPDGELRCYGTDVHSFEDFTHVVLKSVDNGMSWRKEPVTNLTPGASSQSPWSGDWLCLRTRKSIISPEAHPHFHETQSMPILTACPEDGVWCFRSTEGPDGNFTAQLISTDSILIMRLPLALKHWPRWLVTGQEQVDGFTHPVLLISDDDGISWSKKVLPYPPLHEIEWPHKGYRWRQPGVEPVVAEHADGTLQMLLRTSQDFHYQCFSKDGGDSWSPLEPSPFYSVATMPTLLSLADGRLLAVWNHTTPLPELDHDLQAGLDEATRRGDWEDVFTNRDALHAAISYDSGKSWRGFREIVLNPIRNNIDFRTSGGNYRMADRSVHQNQAVELPESKILVGYGQHPKCWGLLVFDLGWLEETHRKDEFAYGLRDWSIHQYIKSLSGGYRGRGHCAWNRRPGAAMVPAPNRAPNSDTRESLQIARHPDSRLVYEKEGAVWNFPAFRKGTISLTLTLSPGTAGMRISLCDRWFNPVDPVVDRLAAFTFEIDSIGRINQTEMLEPGKTETIVTQYDQDAERAIVRCCGREAIFPQAQKVAGTVCYLHLQSMAESSDPYGVLIDAVEFQAD